MKKLENRIIKKMYVMETKKTAASLILKIAGLILFGGIAVILVQVLWDVFTEEKTLDVLEIFRDDAEVVRSYIGGVITVIFQETPKGLLIAIGISVIICLVIVLTFLANFGKMKHRIFALWRYWRNPA